MLRANVEHLGGLLGERRGAIGEQGGSEAGDNSRSTLRSHALRARCMNGWKVREVWRVFKTSSNDDRRSYTRRRKIDGG